jgi:hypothetical protein
MLLGAESGCKPTAEMTSLRQALCQHREGRAGGRGGGQFQQGLAHLTQFM